MNAILYVDRTGIPWRYLPHDFAKRQQDGVFEQLTGLLRRLLREAEGRNAEPSACVLDSQTIKTSANVHLADQGTDAGNRIIGRKRHLGCDTLGLLLTVLVTGASISDTAAGVTLLTRIAAAHPRVTKAWVDAGYRTTAISQGARLGIDAQPVQRPLRNRDHLRRCLRKAVLAVPEGGFRRHEHRRRVLRVRRPGHDPAARPCADHRTADRRRLDVRRLTGAVRPGLGACDVPVGGGAVRHQDVYGYITTKMSQEQPPPARCTWLEACRCPTAD